MGCKPSYFSFWEKVMIRVSEILNEKKEPSGHVIHVLSELPSTEEVSNLVHTLTQKQGKPHIFHTSKITPEIKSHYQSAVVNHKHFFSADGLVNTNMDAVDKISDDKPITVMTHPNQVKSLQDSFKKTHPSRNISVKALPHDKKKPTKPEHFHPSITRADAKKMLGESFEIGDYVVAGDIEGEILAIHPKYATVIAEGEEHRVWTEDLEYSDKQPKRNQLYKESFIYKGYRTKNFNRALSEEFKEISTKTTDEYAMLECLKVFDFIIGVTDETIEEDYKTVRMQTERLKRYSNRVGATYLSEKVVSAVEEELLKYAILENLKFTTTDRIMVAKVVAMVANTAIGNDPSNTINQAVISLRNSQLTPQGWKMLGRLLNVATKAGIRWNKDTFSSAIRGEMELQ